MSDVLELIDFSYTNNHKVIINPISLKVQSKEIYALLGKSDSKIDILINLLIGSIVPFSGTVKLFGNSNYKQEKRRMAYVGKKMLFPNLTIKQNLEYFSTALQITTFNFKTIGLFELDFKDKRSIKKQPYYTGYKLNLLIATLTRVDLIILDNPFKNLDNTECDDLIRIISKIAIKHTILITSDNYHPVSKIATKFGIIHNGNLLAQFTSQQLYDRCKRSVKVRTTNIDKAIVLLNDNGFDYEVLQDDIIRIFAEFDKSAMINKLLVDNDITVIEIFITGSDSEEFISKVMGGENHAEKFD